jgi:parallel beta-helix repeat protein
LALAILLGLSACSSAPEMVTEPGEAGASMLEVDQAAKPVPGEFTTSGEMTADETWSGSLLLTGDMQIPPGVTLTITPGTMIQFTAQSDDNTDCRYDPRDIETNYCTMISIQVFGTLIAQGTESQPILFTTTSETPGELDWQSIEVKENAEVILDHVIMEHGHFSLQYDGINFQSSIRNSVFQNVSKCAICTGPHPINNQLVISDNLFVDVGREAVDTYEGQNILLKNNIFIGNYVAIMSVGSAVTIENNLFFDNLRGIGVIENGTPTITGNQFEGNQGPAIFVVNAQPMNHGNNFVDNVINISLENSTSRLNAEDNWWGTTSEREIERLIVDGLDNPAWGIVSYKPFALAAFDLEIPEY